jgi:hypothetical protein
MPLIQLVGLMDENNIYESEPSTDVCGSRDARDKKPKLASNIHFFLIASNLDLLATEFGKIGQTLLLLGRITWSFPLCLLL